MERDSDADLLLGLYRDAMSCPRSEFQDRAVRVLRRALRFESAIWGGGYLDGAGGLGGRLVPLQVHTDEIDPAGLEHWKAINLADKVIPITIATPGRTHAFHAPTLFSAKADGVMRDYARRFGRQSYLVTSFCAVDSTVREWCSLYRPDADDQFTDAERARCQVLATHLRQALDVNTRLLGGSPGATAPESTDDRAAHTALATPAGHLVSAQPAFTSACAARWREFDGRRLPAAVLKALLEGRGVVRFAKFTLSSRPMAGLLWLRL